MLVYCSQVEKKCHTYTADAIVASRGDNAGATRAEPHEQVAQRYCIVFREILLDVAIRRADRLWDLWLVDHVFEPLEVALLASADGAVVDEWGRVRASDGLGVLGVDVRPLVGFAWDSEVSATDLHEGECRVVPVDAMFVHEGRQIVLARVITTIAHNPEHIPARCGRHVIQRLVQPAQVRWRDRIRIIDPARYAGRAGNLRRAEESVGSRHGHPSERQPAAPV